MIYTVGDSHSKFGWQDIDEFEIKINHVGAKLMHTFGKNPFSVVAPDFYLNLDSDAVVVHCFGEIDCRCHVFKHIREDISYEKVIDTITERYVYSIKSEIEPLVKKSTTLAVYSIVPPIRKKDGQDNSSYPFLGSDFDRLLFHRYANDRLEALCDASGLEFINITDKYSDHEGFLIPEMSDRRCHVGTPSGIIETVKKMGF